MKIDVIINPAAGRDMPILAILNREFGALGVEWEAHVTHGADEARKTALRIADSCDVIAAYGGDGTVSEVANGLLNSKTPLAILPGGTGNVVAQELGIPLDLAEAARLACRGPGSAKPIDALYSRDRAFLLRIGIGAEANAIVNASRERKDEYGWMGYVLSAFEAIREAEPLPFRFVLDGHEMRADAVACIVANIGRIGRGGLNISESILPFDGTLDVLVFRDCRLAGTSVIASSALGIEPEPGDASVGITDAPFQRFHGSRVSISVDGNVRAHGDGDEIEGPPIDIEVRPEALRVILPAK